MGDCQLVLDRYRHMVVADDQLVHGDDYWWAWGWVAYGWIRDDDAICQAEAGNSKVEIRMMDKTSGEQNRLGFHNLLLDDQA